MFIFLLLLRFTFLCILPGTKWRLSLAASNAPSLAPPVIEASGSSSKATTIAIARRAPIPSTSPSPSSSPSEKVAKIECIVSMRLSEFSVLVIFEIWLVGIIYNRMYFSYWSEKAKVYFLWFKEGGKEKNSLHTCNRSSCMEHRNAVVNRHISSDNPHCTATERSSGQENERILTNSKFSRFRCVKSDSWSPYSNLR